MDPAQGTLLFPNSEFSASGLIILERNYLDVYPYDRWSDKVMPQYQMGQTFVPTSLEMVDGETSPPSLLTEADLIALMEKHGIGKYCSFIQFVVNIQSLGLTTVRLYNHDLDAKD
ncbi:DNA topoisomerase 3-alpha [Halocaridina rubra]|uniref:DNA topoisomerase n=1 Tax=Halocaridina rubra TaxID=373956 RepID=A0AAN8XIT0_HALRR